MMKTGGLEHDENRAKKTTPGGLTSVSNLGTCLTTFSTSSSVTSISVQFLVCVSSGHVPFMVTQGSSCNQRAVE